MTGGGYPVGASILGANVLGANVWGEESNKRKPNTTQININTHKLRWEVTCSYGLLLTAP